MSATNRRIPPQVANQIIASYGLSMLNVYGYSAPDELRSCGRGSTKSTMVDGVAPEGDFSDFSVSNRSSEQGNHLPSAAGIVPQEAAGWMEVTRLAIAFYLRRSTTRSRVANAITREGGNNGCWFLAKRGTGVWLPLGRTLRVPNRSVLALKLNLSAASLRSEYMRRNQGAKDLSKATVAALDRRFEAVLQENGTGRFRLEDYIPLCPSMRAKGFDTIQFINDDWEAESQVESSRRAFHEVVSCWPSCMSQLIPNSSPCAPGTGPGRLRTGWRATLPCECRDSMHVLNCADTPIAQPATPPSLTAPRVDDLSWPNESGHRFMFPLEERLPAAIPVWLRNTSIRQRDVPCCFGRGKR